MKKITIKCLLKDAKISGFVGIGISLTFTIATGGLSLNVYHWISSIVFGFLIGSLLSFGNEFAISIFFKIFPNCRKPTFLLLVIVYVVSVVIFYGFAFLFGSVFRVIPPGAEIFYVSLGVGIACVMITIFFIYAGEKEEMLRLEKENKELAVVDERNRIARELHDSVSQNLFGISLHLNTLALIIERDAVKAREISKLLQGMVEEVQNEMRLMIYELRPAALTEKGFFEAMENLVNLFRVRYNLEIRSDIHGDESLDSQKQLVLYRVLQESLNNIVKHAKATKVKVALTVENGVGEMAIQDNGKGFLIKDIDESEHFGIKGMKERVAEMKGQFSVESATGMGASVKVRF